MIREIDIALTPEEAYQEKYHIKIISGLINVPESKISFVRIIKRSIDARRSKIIVNLRFIVGIEEEKIPINENIIEYQNVANKKEILIIGAGPAGLFAALQLISSGLKPIIFERGKDVSNRKKDIAIINREQIINPESNYAFGEGGAGAFSDGKLFTRSKKRGNIENVLNILKQHGADENILIDVQPHIGSDKLPQIIKNIRETIIKSGGEIHFNTKIIDFIIHESKIKGVINQHNEKIYGNAVILATGHSARDIYNLFYDKKILIQQKPYAMGVRIEHPQELINQIQYHSKFNKYLPPATYNLVCQINNHGVYSFCMCPGGTIVPASTSNEEIVLNGMSSSKRNSVFANAGLVVEIQENDLKDYRKYNELSGLKYQQNFEELAKRNGGGGLVAPAQRLSDFINNKLSSSLPVSSYIPGLIPSPLHSWFPENIAYSLQNGIKHFGKLMNGFITNEAIIVGVESRTSSPLRIPRNDTMQHPEIERLYPCGEGAGYSGGIVSSAIDGMNCAKKISEIIT